MTKFWLKSKTILFNLAALAAVALQVGLFGNLVPLEYDVVAFAAANVILRFVTNQGVSAPAGADVLEAATAVKGAVGAVKRVVLRK